MAKLNAWKKEIKDHKYSILFSLVFLAVAVILDYAAGTYVSRTQGVVAPDLILDYIPTIDLDFLFVYGIILVIALLFIYPLFFKVKEFHKVIGQFSLLVMVRAAFTSFTHLQIPSDALEFQVPRIISFLIFQNDLFFSGHTAVAFLGLLLSRDKKIKYFFLIASIILGATVLLMHVHYTIDVLSAFFITYGTFKIGEWFFNRVNHYRY